MASAAVRRRGVLLAGGAASGAGLQRRATAGPMADRAPAAGRCRTRRSGVRWPFLLLGDRAAAVRVRLGTAFRRRRRCARGRTAVAAAAAVGASLGVLALPDVPLAVAALLLAITLSNALASNRWRDWIAFGAGAGAWLRWRTIASPCCWPPALGFLLGMPRGRAPAARTAVLAGRRRSARWARCRALLFNLQHDFARACASSSSSGTRGRSMPRALNEPLVQAVVATPALAVLIVAAIARAWQRRARTDAPHDVLAACAGGLLLLQLVGGLFADAERVRFHWPCRRCCWPCRWCPTCCATGARPSVAARSGGGRPRCWPCRWRRPGTLALFVVLVHATPPGDGRTRRAAAPAAGQPAGLARGRRTGPRALAASRIRAHTLVARPFHGRRADRFRAARSAPGVRARSSAQCQARPRAAAFDPAPRRSGAGRQRLARGAAVRARKPRAARSTACRRRWRCARGSDHCGGWTNWCCSAGAGAGWRMRSRRRWPVARQRPVNCRRWRTGPRRCRTPPGSGSTWALRGWAVADFSGVRGVEVLLDGVVRATRELWRALRRGATASGRCRTTPTPGGRVQRRAGRCAGRRRHARAGVAGDRPPTAASDAGAAPRRGSPIDRLAPGGAHAAASGSTPGRAQEAAQQDQRQSHQRGRIVAAQRIEQAMPRPSTLKLPAQSSGCSRST